MPAPRFAAVPLMEDTAYVLDFSTLPLMYELHRDQQLALPPRLWVSRCLVEIIEGLLLSKQAENAPAGRVNVIGGRLYPYTYPEDYKEQTIAKLQALLDWIMAHCQTRPVYEKLDITRQLQAQDTFSKRPHHEVHMDYVVDTLFLADQPHNVLVTDDTMMLNLLANGRMISSEMFLRRVYEAQYEAVLLPELVQKHYIGLVIAPSWILEQFNLSGYRFEGMLLQALRSVAAFVHDVREFLPILCVMARYFYESHKMQEMEKSQAVRTLFQEGLRFIPPSPVFNRSLAIMLGQAVQNQPYRFRVQKDLAAAIAHLKEMHEQREAKLGTDEEEPEMAETDA